MIGSPWRLASIELVGRLCAIRSTKVRSLVAGGDGESAMTDDEETAADRAGSESIDRTLY
jgi:hypothetical protein